MSLYNRRTLRFLIIKCLKHFSGIFVDSVAFIGSLIMQGNKTECQTLWRMIWHKIMKAKMKEVEQTMSYSWRVMCLARRHKDAVQWINACNKSKLPSVNRQRINERIRSFFFVFTFRVFRIETGTNLRSLKEHFDPTNKSFSTRNERWIEHQPSHTSAEVLSYRCIHRRNFASKLLSLKTKLLG